MKLNIKRNSERTTIAGVIVAAIAASVCCVGPLLLLGLGIGGAWIGSLTALEPFRPYFMVLTFIILGIAFYKIYGRAKKTDCVPGSYCANPNSDRWNKRILWLSTIFVLLLLATPYMAGYFSHPTERSVENNLAVKRVTLNVPDMSCPACPFTVQKSLNRLPGVVTASANLEKKSAVVIYDPGKVSVADMIKATTEAGYPSQPVVSENNSNGGANKHEKN